MDEGDPRAPAPDTWLGVDETGTCGSEMSQRGLDRDHCVGDMVQTLTLLRQEFAHRGFRAKGAKKLDERPTDRDHRLLNSLILHGLPVKRLDVVTDPVAFDGCVQVCDCDGHMIEIEQLHPVTVLPRRVPVTPRPVRSHP